MEEQARFSDEKVSFLVERMPGSIMQYTVTAKKPLMDESFKKAVKTVQKNVQKPGFRKGKAPESYVINNYPSHIEQQQKDELSQLAFDACTKLRACDKIQNGKVRGDIKSFGKEEALLTISFEVDALIPDIDFSTLTYTKVEPKAVSEEDIDKAVNKLRLLFAGVEEITGRHLKDGDIVHLDVENLSTKETFRGAFEFGNEKTCQWPHVLPMPSWQKELLTGKMITQGEELVVEGESKVDASMSEDLKSAFPVAPFRIKLTKALQLKLPELNDEFVTTKFKDHPKNLNSVADFRNYVKQILEKHAIDEAKEAERESLNESLVEKLQFDVPQTLVGQEYNYRVEQLKRDREFMEGLSKMSPEEVEKEKVNLFNQCRKAIQMFYLTQKVIKEQNIQLTAEEFSNETPDFIAYFLNPEGYPNPMQGDEGRRAETYSRRLMTKAQDFFFTKASAKTEKKEAETKKVEKALESEKPAEKRAESSKPKETKADEAPAEEKKPKKAAAKKTK